MSAPADTTRIESSGIKMKDGYQSLIAPAADSNIAFWEMDTGLPGLDGGDAIDNTTQHNATYRTKRARALITMTEFTVTAAYDPDLYNEILAILNVEGAWTVTFPDLSTVSFFAWLRLFNPAGLVEGTMPECTITIEPSNWDPVANAEEALVLTSVAGT